MNLRRPTGTLKNQSDKTSKQRITGPLKRQSGQMSLRRPTGTLQKGNLDIWVYDDLQVLLKSQFAQRSIRRPTSTFKYSIWSKEFDY